MRAPWSGRVVETKAHKHETVAPGQELLSIVDDSKLEIELIVPSKWLGWVTKETRFRLRVDETVNEYAAKVSQVGARVDPVSQTVRLTAVLEGKNKGLLVGMSGTAHFDVPMAGSP